MIAVLLLTPRRAHLDRRRIVPGVVLVYFSRLGGRLKTHQEIMLATDAEAIAGLKGYEFGGIMREQCRIADTEVARIPVSWLRNRRRDGTSGDRHPFAGQGAGRGTLLRTGPSE
jgi:hypothetical protein